MDYFTAELLTFLCVLVALFLIMAGHVKKKRWLFLITLTVTIIALNNYQLVSHVVQTQTLLQAGLDLVHSIFTLVSLHLTFPSRVKVRAYMVYSVLALLGMCVMYVCKFRVIVLGIRCVNVLIRKISGPLEKVPSLQKNAPQPDDTSQLSKIRQAQVKDYKTKLSWKLNRSKRRRLKQNAIIAAASRDVIAYPATPLYHDYESRLATFNSHNFRAWGVSGLPLASTGFYYTERGDFISCYRCQREIHRSAYHELQGNLHAQDCPIRSRSIDIDDVPPLFQR